MKKLFLLALSLIMTLSLVACGGETSSSNEATQSVESTKPAESTNLVDITTDKGISLKLPSGMTLQDNLSYINTETGDSAVFGVSEVAGNPLSGWKEENVLATYQSKYKDVVVKSFENGKKINGKEALVSTVTLKTPNDNALTIILVILTDGTKNYVVNLGYGSDNADSVLAKNLQACIDSITIKN